jgi:Glycosyltransferase family 87
LICELRFRRDRLVTCWGVAVAVQSLLVIVAIVNTTSLGFSYRMSLDNDIRIYFEYARPILEGRLPYLEYRVEYPILAIAVFVAPLIAGTSFEAYRVGFMIEMMLLNSATVWLVARQVAKTDGIEQIPVRLAWYTVFFAVLCPLIVIRFDIVPMTLAFAAVYSMTRGRMVTGGVLIGLGILVKLVPGLVLLPIVAKAGPWRPREKALMGATATAGLGVVSWWLLGGYQVILSLRYHGERGLELGSLYASAFMVAHKVAGISILTGFGYGSMNIIGNGTNDAASLSTIVQGACLLLVVWRARRSGPGQEFRFAAASLLAYVAFGKVLSPQYLIWLLPFVCVLDGPTGKLARKVYLACVLLTNLIYPHLFLSLANLESHAVAVLVARNLGLIGLFAILLGSNQAAITPTRSSPEACS